MFALEYNFKSSTIKENIIDVIKTFLLKQMFKTQKENIYKYFHFE